MKKWIRRSFRNRIFLTVLLVTLLPLLFCNVLMMQMQVVRSEISLAQEARAQLTALDGALDELCLSFEEMADELCESTAVRSVLRQKSADSRVLYQLLFRVTDELREYARFDICDREGLCLYTTDATVPTGTLYTDWGILCAASGSVDLVFRSGEGDVALTAARAVRSHDSAVLGYVVVSMSPENFDYLFQDLYSTTSDIILMDPFWRPVYHSQPAQTENAAESLRQQLLAGEPLTGAGGDYYYYTSPHQETGMSLILQQPMTFTSTVMHTIYAVSLLMGLLCLLLCLWCAWLLSRHLFRPIRQLDEAMGEVRKGNFDVHLDTGREDELGRLADSFNHMADEYQANLSRSVARQRELNETQLRMMQAQLNPHFLYNTLDTMKWLGVTHHVPQIAELASDLATILRAGISGDEIITVEQELELIDRYLAIQSIRFEDRFTCEIDIPEEFQSCLIPKMVLQPLVENAIIHGVADKNDGYIKLWAEEKEGDLFLSVSDNGCGIPPEQLADLNQRSKKKPADQGSHLGLFNVNSIIRLHFGEPYGLSVRSQPGEGCCATLRLPIQRRRDENA